MGLGRTLERGQRESDAYAREAAEERQRQYGGPVITRPTGSAGAPAAATTAGKKFRWPDGKLHSRPYRG